MLRSCSDIARLTLPEEVSQNAVGSVKLGPVFAEFVPIVLQSAMNSFSASSADSVRWCAAADGGVLPPEQSAGRDTRRRTA